MHVRVPGTVWLVRRAHRKNVKEARAEASQRVASARTVEAASRDVSAHRGLSGPVGAELAGRHIVSPSSTTSVTDSLWGSTPKTAFMQALDPAAWTCGIAGAGPATTTRADPLSLARAAPDGNATGREPHQHDRWAATRRAMPASAIGARRASS